MKLYIDALQKGWRLSTQYAWLWFFGFFALFITGNGSEIDYYLSNIKKLTSQYHPLSPSFWEEKNWQTITSTLSSLWHANSAIFIFLGIIIAVATAAIIYFIIASEIALIYAASSNSKKKITFFDCANSINRKNFSSVLIINILKKCSIITFIGLSILPFLSSFMNNRGAIPQLIYISLNIFLLIPVILTVAFISKYAINYAAINNLNAWEAVKKALQLFVKNWIISLEMAFIILFLSFFLGLIILVGVIILSAPALVANLFIMIANGSIINFYYLIFVDIIIFSLAFILGAALFSTWQNTAWTYLFLDLNKKNQTSHLVRLMKRDG